jgi:hypothetical protein
MVEVLEQLVEKLPPDTHALPGRFPLLSSVSLT